MSMLRRMLTSVPKEYWAIAKWNNKYNAVEIINIRSPYETHNVAEDIFDFLTLPETVKQILDLTFLQDGTVLSGQGLFQNIRGWAAKCEEAGFKTTIWSDDRANVLIELAESPSRWIELGDDLHTNIVCLGDERFSGFPNRLTAERFLMRLLPREKGLYFLDGTDEELMQLFDSNPDDQRLNWNTLSVGYGDMPYSISSSNEEGEVDSIYFTWLDLPDWCGQYVVVQSALDCNSASFCEDFEADVVAIEDLDLAMQSMIDRAVEWFGENDVPLDFTEVEELRKTIVAEIQREYPEIHPQIRSIYDALKFLKVETAIGKLDLYAQERHLTAAVINQYGKATVQPIGGDGGGGLETIGIFVIKPNETVEQGTEFFFPFSQHSLLQCLNQLK